MSEYDSYILEYTVHAEYQQLEKHQIPNVYVIPSANSSLIWYGVIFLHSGIYAGGIFRFTLFLPDNFPNECPRIIFNPIVYHPRINSESGELDIKQYITTWKRNIHHIYQLLFYVRRMFYQVDIKNAINKDAADLYENDKRKFKQRVNDFLCDCERKLYELPPINQDDAHVIKFSPLDIDTMQKIKKDMKNYLSS